MCEKIKKFLQTVSDTGKAANRQSFLEWKLKALDYLKGLSEIRALVAGSKNFGHCASTVSILRTLVQITKKTDYKICIYARSEDEESLIIDTLRILIPQFQALNQPFKMLKQDDPNNVTVISLRKIQPDPAEFGICGGFDTKERSDLKDAIIALRVNNYVQLQPYKWNEGMNCAYFGGNVINLDEKFPEIHLQRRVFCQTLPSELTLFDREVIKGSPFAQKLPVIDHLVQQSSARKVNICPLYGLGTRNEWLPPAVLYNICAGVLQTQKGEDDEPPLCALPAVMILIEEIGENDWNLFKRYVTEPSIITSQQVKAWYMKPSLDFVKWHKAADVKNRISWVGSPGSPATLTQVESAVGNLQNEKVLVVYLGKLPQVLFNFTYYKSTLPPLFEGQATADFVLNFGKPYFKWSQGIDDIAFDYPTMPISADESGIQAEIHRDSAKTVFLEPGSWSDEETGTMPPLDMYSTIEQFLQPESDPYFFKLGDFFHDEVHDKLFWGLGLFWALKDKEHAQLESAVAVGDSTIEKLYESLKQNTHDGSLDLLGVMTSGLVNTFFGKIVNDRIFHITSAVSGINREKTEVTLTGVSSAFPVGSVSVSFKFTENDSDLVTALEAQLLAESLEFPGAAWLAIPVSPGFRITLDEGGATAVSGAMTLTMEAGVTVNVAVPLPTLDGAWLLQADFGNSLPDLNEIFRFVGGINLTALLPEQLQVLTSIKVRRLEMSYDLKKGSLEYVSISLGTPEGTTWNLVPAVDIGNLRLQAMVAAPGDLAKRRTTYRAGAEFLIGEGTVKIDASMPKLRVNGALAGDSKPIRVASVIKAYLGNDFVQVLPDLVKNAEINLLTFLVDKPLGAYGFAMGVKTKWPIDIGGKTVFEITNLGLAVNATSRDIDPPKEGKKGDGSTETAIVVRGSANGKQNQTTTEITGKFAGSMIILPNSAKKIGLTVSAAYEAKGKGWTFDGRTTTPINLGDLLREQFQFDPGEQAKYSIDSLALTITTGDNSWLFVGTASDWKIDFLDLTINKASVKAGYNGAKNNALLHPALLASPVPRLAATGEGMDNKGYFADIEVDTAWLGMNINAWVKFAEGKKPTWGAVLPDFGLHTEVAPNDKEEWVGEFGFTENVTLGSLIETMVSWITGTKFGLEAPWSVLSDISLSDLKLTYNFTTKNVTFDVKIGPIDLGIMSIKTIGVNYASGNVDSKKNGLMVSLTGSFPWNVGDGAMGDTGKLGPWDASKPGSSPSPPGDGNKYFDLRLLALGQHVTVPGLIEEKSVKGVIDLLEQKLEIPKPPDIPINGKNQPVFDARSSWFVAFDFGVLKVEKEKKNGNGTPAATSVLPGYGGGENHALVPADSRALALAPKNGNEEAPAQYFISLAIVFNDPYIYGLRVGLEGPMAKMFAGLDFQIMYQQVSKNVGRYSAEIALPSIMRKLQIGVASITLPKFGIEVYTNGDFQFDIGFPWKEDFSLSFSIEIQAGPLPVLGSAGFYFGKLSSATTDKVPQTTKGWFNPVIVFGFGAQIGLGKSVEAGILKAGFSLTVFGIIEGVIARWLPYGEVTPGGDKHELQDGYYFALTGTMGVEGSLYGSINFAIISAELNVAISIYVRITFASYEPIPITARASVDVTLTIKLDLGLFTINISLGFKASVEATFVLDNPMRGPAPWAIDKMMSAPERLTARGLDKVFALQVTELVAMSAEVTTFPANWDNLDQGTTLRFNGWVVPVLAVAGDAATQPDQQKICYVVNFFLEGEKPIQTHESGALQARSDAQVVAKTVVAHAALERARSVSAMTTGADKFEKLAVRVLQWVIAAGQEGKRTPDDVNDLVISDDFLASALSYLSGAKTPTPIPLSAIEGFLKLQTEFLFGLKQDARTNAEGNNEPAPVVFFPAVPGITLDVPAFAGSEEYKYAFGDYNSSSARYLDFLNKYFNQLKIQVEEEQKNREGLLAADAPPDTGPSIATYIFCDYFAMIGRLMIQAMRDGLRNYKLVIADYSGKTVQQIVDDINTKGDLAGPLSFTVGELFVANEQHALNPAASPSPALTIAGMTWQSAGGKSFDDIAEESIFQGHFDATALAQNNAANATIIAPGIQIARGDDIYTTQSADSLNTIASKLKFVDVKNLLDAVPKILTDAKLLASQAILDLPPFPHKIVVGDTLQTVATRYGIDLDALARTNGGVKDLFDRVSDPNLNVPHLAQYQVGALIEEMSRTLALQHLSAMVSRYYLHGLRLPTRFKEGNEKLTPNADGLFVRKGGQYPKDLGLYALTGQAFPLPDIPDPSKQKPEDPKFSFSLTRGNEAWLSLGVVGGTSLTFTLDDKHGDNSDYLRYAGVKKIALAGFLDTQSFNIKPLDAAATKPGRYPLSLEIQWQPAVAVTLPNQKVTPSTPRPRLWSLPSELINIPNATGVHPTLKPVLARTDESKGITVDEDVNNYGFGTLVTFRVKKIQASGLTGIAQRTYEIIGAPESEITLLERLLDQLKDEGGTFDQIGLFYRPSPTGSNAKGWQSDDPASSLMAITQTNLSTETRPPTREAMATVAAKEHANLIGTPNEFLRLLWEASITRQGGFYLSYTTGIGAAMKGLPDHAFNDREEAEVAVFALFTGGLAQGQALSNYMNVTATNEPFDLSHAALIAVAVPVAVMTAKNFAAGDTLASYAASYYTGPGILAEQNATVAFKADVKVTIEGGLYEVPPKSGKQPSKDDPGGDLSLIAAHFKTSVEEIKKVNAAGGKLPDQLDPYTAIKLPQITIDAKGNSFDSLSKYYHAPIPKIAAANRDVVGLFPDAPLSVTIGPASLAPGLKQGVAGITLERPAPHVPDSPNGDWGEEYLRQNFGLLGYRVADNPQNHYFPESNWGLPCGPINPKPADDGDKIQAPRAESAGDTWHFSFAVPYASVFATGQLYPSPYGGVGGLLQFDLAWLDIFGNRILSEFDAPQPPAGTPLNRQPQITGYTDRLLGVGQWPAVAHAYQVIKDSEGAPNLKIMLDFDSATYQEAADAEHTAADSGKQKIKQSIAVYTLIVQQLNDPAGVIISLATTVTPSANWVVPDQSTAHQQSLKEWAEGILKYLEALRDAPNSNPPIPLEYALQVPLDISKINTDQIFKLSTTLTLSRKSPLVAGELSTAPGVAEAATRIAPLTGPLTSNLENSQPQRTLVEFAKDFKDAFAFVPDASFRIATGSDRNVFTGGGKGPLWVVQLGNKKTKQPISYTIKDVGEPTVFAPLPISNVLRSKAKTPIIEYKTGTVISSDGKSEDRSFLSIDLDKWMGIALGYIDELLSPRYVSPAEILRKNIKGVPPPAPSPAWGDALQEALDAKKALALSLRAVMIPVYQGETANSQQLQDIQEAFYQSMLGTMGQFYTIKAGVQFEADVEAAIKRQPEAEDVPRIFGDISMKPVKIPPEARTVGDPPVQKNISVSSPKLDLKFAGRDIGKSPSPYLSSLVSSTAADAKMVTLKLDYNGQYIEHEIGTLKGIDGYKPSSWLAFVDVGSPADDENWPLRVELGQFDVPIVLREFPDTPTLVNQEEISQEISGSPSYKPITDESRDVSTSGLLLNTTDCVKTGNYDPLAKATRWSYAFEYSMQVHHSQDAIHGKISFNIVDRSGVLAMEVPKKRELFDDLAQFTQIYPRVRADLNEFLVPIDVNTKDPTTLKNAQCALESAAAMINWLAASASELGTRDDGLFTASAPMSVGFTISEDSVEKNGVDALQVTVQLTSDLPPRVGMPLVEIDGYTYERVSGDDQRKSVFFYRDHDGRYLPARIGQKIPGRKFVLPDMDILERQDAQAEVYLTRNADIVPNKTIAERFVYTTPKVSFESPLHPTLFIDESINLATIFSDGKDKPVRRTLECQLSFFYEALFANAGTSDVTLQSSLYYEYAINPEIARIRLPVYLMPPTLTAIRDGGTVETTLTEIIAKQVKGWETWFKTHSPETKCGRLSFDLTIMSNLTQRPMPILRLTGLYLPVTDLEGIDEVAHGVSFLLA
jgi:LysM repeat protein